VNPALSRVLDRLNARQLHPHEVNGVLMALCPNHYDRNHRKLPTLVIRLSEDESHVHIFCTRGCSTTSILRRLRLHWDDLYTERWRSGPQVKTSNWRDHPLVRKAIEVFGAVPLTPRQKNLSSHNCESHDRQGNRQMLWEVLNALESRGCRPKKYGNQWIAHCPAHNDRRPSLSIRECDDRRVLMHCFAGCAVENIVAALGLRMKDLAPVGTNKEAPSLNKEIQFNQKTYATAEEAKKAWAQMIGRPHNHEWVYLDTNHDAVGYILRWDTPDGKIIRPISLFPDGWRLVAMPTPRLLYNLPGILIYKDSPVFVMEGEKAADVGWDCDLVSTTSAGGCNAAHQTDWSPLRGRKVIILPDNDEPGERYAESVVKLCFEAGAADIRIIKLANYAKELPPGGDLYDVVNSSNYCGLPVSQGSTKTDTKKNIGRLLCEIAQQIEPWSPKSTQTEEQHKHVSEIDRQSGLRFTVHFRDGRKNPIVIAWSDDKEIYREEMNVNRGEARKEFAKEVARMLGRDVKEIIKLCHSELPKLADKAAEEAMGNGVCGLDKSPVRPWPDIWPEPVVLSDVLNEVYNAIRRHVILKHEDAIAITLWTAWTYVYDSGSVCPMLSIVSPSRRCGKTTLLTVLFRLVARGIFASNITPAAVYRVIKKYGPLTLLIDEADTFAKDNEELKGIINSGHDREGANVARVVKKADNTDDVGWFSTWCAKAIASIGSQHSTWSDRSITIRMARKAKNETVERLTPEAKAYLDTLSRKIYTAVATDEIKTALAERFPEVPECLDDRAADNWRPLLCIADIAGGNWPIEARKAATVLSGGEQFEDNEETAVRLLLDALEVFYSDEKLTARELAERLATLDESPWATYRRGRPISAETVGKYLRRFGVKPERNKKSRIYYRSDIEEVAKRYSTSEITSSHDDFSDEEDLWD
jgi:hypothetical protein